MEKWKNGKRPGRATTRGAPTNGVFYYGIVLGDGFSRITSGHTKSVVSKTTLAHDNPTPNAEARMR